MKVVRIRNVALFVPMKQLQQDDLPMSTHFVIFQPNGLGDLLMLLPFIRKAVESVEPGRLTLVLANRQQATIVRKVIRSPIRIFLRKDGKPFPSIRLYAKLWLINNAVIFAPLLSSKMKSKLFFGVLGKSVVVPRNVIPLRIGKVHTSELSLATYQGHQVLYYFDFLASMRVRAPTNEDELLSLTRLATPSRQSLGRNTKHRIALGISCGSEEQHKIPRKEFFAELVNAIAEKNTCSVALIGGVSDTAAVNEMAALLSRNIEVIKLIDKDPIELIAVMSEYSLGIAGTTGQGHMMAAAGLPMLVLSGVTNPYNSGPYSHRVAILRHEYECGPCYQEEYRFGCRLVKCMDHLSVAHGVRLAESLLNDEQFGRKWYRCENHLQTQTIERIHEVHKSTQSKWSNALLNSV